jgi:hypothetical protein
MPSFTTRPDPRYYQAVVQHDDGSYTADQKPLDDRPVTLMDFAKGEYVTATIPGLRSTIISEMINPQTTNMIYQYAPDWMQRNANNIISQPGNYTAQQVQNAKDLWTWVNQMVAHSNGISATVQAMTFEQLVTFVVPTTGWPAPPASLVPVAPTSLKTYGA